MIGRIDYSPGGRSPHAPPAPSCQGETGRAVPVPEHAAQAVAMTPLEQALTLAPPALARADFRQLVRPRRVALVLATVAAGGLLAPGATDWVLLVQAVVGTALVAAGASCLNQLLERHTDALMPRTAGRPLPAGRVLPEEVLALGGGL